jgi:hypothetical protein
MITNIRKTRNPIALPGIGGEPMRIVLEGDLVGYGTAYHHPKIAANKFSFYRMTKQSVRYNNTQKNSFMVTRDDDSIMEFVPSKEGLYHYDIYLSIKRKMESQKEKVLVVNTVEEIKRSFTKKELEKADEARRLYVIVVRPSRKQFEEMIKSRKIVNKMITIQDYRNALQMYGIDLGVLKVKTVRVKPDEIKVQFLEGPKPKNIVLSVDIMYVSSHYC